ncbi:MAG: sigma-70 family RNA polymerase sigma factor [Actinomycetota bacterium]
MTLGDDFDVTLEAARAGAEWAWTAIYRDLAAPVTGYLRARGATEPEDLTGEVFLQLVRDLNAFSGDERDFRAWVFTIAHHRMLDATRSAGRRPAAPVDHRDLAEETANVDTAETALRSLAVDRVRRLIRRLSPDQQDVLLLRLFGDLTVDEVALAVGKRPGAVKALQRRGLAALKREISREGVTL